MALTSSVATAAPENLSPSFDENRGPSIDAILWTEVVVASLFVSIRLYSRHLIKGMGIDDLLMFVALVNSILFFTLSS